MSGPALRCTMVSVVVLRGRHGHEQLLLLRRASEYLPGAWAYVAGHVRPEEPAWRAARRELLEETGLVPESLYATSFCEQFYAVASNTIEVVPAFVATVPTDAEVRLNAEHSAFQWLPLPAAANQVPFGSQRDLFAHIQREFIERTPSEFLRLAGA